MKLLKKFWAMACLILFMGIMAYGSLWAYSAYFYHNAIHEMTAQANSRGIAALGAAPRFGGFPWAPQITMDIGIKTPRGSVMFPIAILKGYPLPGRDVTLSFPQGVQFEGEMLPPLLSADRASMTVLFPHSWPQSWKRDSIVRWQKHDGRLVMRDFTVEKDSLKIAGKGQGGFDSALQPLISIDAVIMGHETFLSALGDGIIAPLALATTRGFLNSMEKIDPQTGARIVPLMISVRDRRLSVGPLQVARLPEIVWDTHTAPALRQ